MQLGQPIQGVHPEDSGKSVLDYLMKGHTTVPKDIGIFLPITYRMHPDVCKFVSDVSYDGRLLAEKKNTNQRLHLQSACDPCFKETGIKFVSVNHNSCSQSSIEEAHLIRKLTENLLEQLYSDKSGKTHRMTLDNILIIAPYNMQVNLLKKELPEGARVGTVDKFQGQEAEVVIISMTTSNGEYLPRFIDFLFSRQRLNVAISRARCFVLLVANPDLLEVQCKTIEQMSLVNTLCRAYNTGTAVHEY